MEEPTVTPETGTAYVFKNTTGYVNFCENLVTELPAKYELL